ncbi:MAG: SAM-dependent methyltransferase [Bacteroidales bacterium]|nr:SAM-dependent methyltransferase [Bacteroidales bacterium]
MYMFDKTDRYKYGQFFTPSSMCNKILKMVDKINPIQGDVLEPSFGKGNFLKALQKYKDINSITGVEIDKDFFSHFTKRNKNICADLENIDFLDFKNKRQFDLIIGNPPYIELCYSFYDKDKIEQIKNDYKDMSNKGRMNIVHIFLLRSLEMIKDGGIIAFLLPTAILTSPVYNKIREKIYDDFSVKYVNEHIEFDDITLRICLLIIKKEKTKDKNFFYVTNNNFYITNNFNKIKTNKTLKDYGFEVEIGEVVWNKRKDILTDDNRYNKLIYSYNITRGHLIDKRSKNEEKKSFIKKTKVRHKNCIILPRTIYKELRFFYVENNKDMNFENHVLVIKNKNKALLKAFYDKLQDDEYEKIIKTFFNSTNLTIQEVLSLPY